MRILIICMKNIDITSWLQRRKQYNTIHFPYDKLSVVMYNKSDYQRSNCAIIINNVHNTLRDVTIKWSTSDYICREILMKVVMFDMYSAKYVGVHTGLYKKCQTITTKILPSFCCLIRLLSASRSHSFHTFSLLWLLIYEKHESKK